MAGRGIDFGFGEIIDVAVEEPALKPPGGILNQVLPYKAQGRADIGGVPGETTFPWRRGAGVLR